MPTFDVPSARQAAVDALMRPLNTAAWRTSASYRRSATETEPLLFALTYLDHHLTSRLTGGRYSLAELHLDMAESARGWLADRPARDIWVAPRGAAKSTWAFLILPLWALAHGHRRFLFALADSTPQARKHLATLRTELEDNALLLNDFPALRPSRVRGRTDSHHAVMRGGAAIVAQGVDAKSLGTKIGRERPDLIVLDDLEPDESNYSLAAKDKRLRTVLQAILPMNERAAVCWTGTVTMADSMIHDAVRHAREEQPAAWIADEGFRVHYYPPVLTDERGRRSFWPARYALEYLDSIVGTRNWALNFANRPELDETGGWWDPSLFARRRVPTGRQILSVDVAVTSAAHSDYSAIAGLSLAARRDAVVVEFCTAGRWNPAEFRAKLHTLIRDNPRVDEVILETNQGGELWAEMLAPLPRGVRLTPYRVAAPKRVRLKDLLHHYQQGHVLHPVTLDALERQMSAYPNVTNDDLMDAVAAGVRHLIGAPA